MANELNFIPAKVLVGVKPRDNWDSNEINLSFFTYKGEDGKIKKENSWNNWRDQLLAPIELDNVLLDGFSLLNTTKRSSDWFGTGRSVWRIQHPSGYTFEIDSSNFEGIIQSVGINAGGSIAGKCILVWRGQKLLLAPEKSVLYKESSAATKRQLSTIDINDVKIGSKVRLKDNTTGIYLGKFKGLFASHPRDESYITYYNWYDKYFILLDKVKSSYKKSNLDINPKLNICEIINEDNLLSNDEALDIIKKELIQYSVDNYTEVYAASIEAKKYELYFEESQIDVSSLISKKDQYPYVKLKNDEIGWLRVYNEYKHDSNLFYKYEIKDNRLINLSDMDSRKYYNSNHVNVSDVKCILTLKMKLEDNTILIIK